MVLLTIGLILMVAAFCLLGYIIHECRKVEKP